MGAQLYVVNVEAAIYKDDKWLMAKRSLKEDHASGVISMVGGKVETTSPGNNVLEETVKREVLEEVGVEIYDDIKYVKSSIFLANFGKYVIDIVFLCRYKAGEARVCEPEELDSVEWLSINEILADEKIPIFTKEALKLADQMR